MKKLSIASALLLAFAASGASAEDKIRARLIGYQEVPSVSTGASGRFEASVHPDGKAFDYELEYSGLQAPVTQAHIHLAQRAVNGPIIIWLCGTASNPGPAGTQPCPQSGTITGTVMAANVLAAQPAQQLTAGEIEEAIAAMRAGAAYANVHTAVSTGGEIRGQLGTRGSHGRGHRH
jgi:hypothetical protein